MVLRREQPVGRWTRPPQRFATRRRSSATMPSARDEESRRRRRRLRCGRSSPPAARAPRDAEGETPASSPAAAGCDDDDEGEWIVRLHPDSGQVASVARPTRPTRAGSPSARWTNPLRPDELYGGPAARGGSARARAGRRRRRRAARGRGRRRSAPRPRRARTRRLAGRELAPDRSDLEGARARGRARGYRAWLARRARRGHRGGRRAHQEPGSRARRLGDRARPPSTGTSSCRPRARCRPRIGRARPPRARRRRDGGRRSA